MSSLSTLPKGDSAWLLRKAIERIMEQVSVLETNIGSSTTGNSANTQIIFNDNGTLRGDAGLVYNKTTDALTVAGLVTAGSATITGDLTVDTNVLKVNTTTNRVGINTTTPNQNLEITGSGNPLTADGCSAVRLNNTVSGRAAIVGIDDSQNFIIWNLGTDVSETIKFLTGGGSGKEQYRITNGGVFNWYDGLGGTRMTLNSTGLGIGASPSSLLYVQKSQNADTTLVVNNTNSGASASARLDLQSHASNYLTLQSYGQNYSGNVCGIAAAKLNTILDNALTANSTGLLIGTVSTNPLYFVTANAVKMTLDASGNLGIGTATPATNLHIINDTAATNSAVNVLTITQSSTGTAAAGLGGGVLFKSERPSGGLILNRGAIYGVSGTDPDDDGDLAFYTLTDTGPTGFSEKVRINAIGNIVMKTVNTGIDFSINSDASATSELLDDYEEGTWTIGLTFGGGNTGLTTSTSTGRYTKVGRQVFVTGYLALTNKGSSTGVAVITGLPFTVAGSPEAYSGTTLRLNGVSYTGAVQTLVNAGSTTVNLEQLSILGAVTDITDSNFTNATSFMCSFTYTV